MLRPHAAPSARRLCNVALCRVSLCCVASWCLASCADDGEDKFAGSPRRTVPEVASQEERFAAFSDSVTSSGLTTVLSDPEAEFTVFAPNNAAFAEFEDELSRLSTVEIVALLAYHVVPGVIPFDELGELTSLTTLEGEVLPVIVNEDGTVEVGPENWRGTIIDADIEASNGLLHEIDGVLFSPTARGE